MTMKTLLTKCQRFWLLFALLAVGMTVQAQIPTYKLYVTNESSPSPTEYEFDVFLLQTGTTPLQLATIQFGLGVDLSILNGGTPTVSIVPGTSELQASQQPTNVIWGGVTYVVGGVSYRYFNCAAKSPPGFGNGHIISDIDGGCAHPGTRIARYRLVNSIPFATNSTAKHSWSVTAGSQRTATQVNAYIQSTGLNTNVSTGVQATSNLNYDSPGTCIQNIILNPAASCALTESSSTTQTSCFGAADGSATVTLGGIGIGAGGTYSVDLGPAIPYTGSSFTITGLAAGSYSVEVTTDATCSVTSLFTITQPSQPPAPTVACYETATWNSATCMWDITGTQPPAPTGLACWETATFNNTTCVWDVTGTQPAMPTLACYETATFNNTTCVWDVTGTQPAMPTLACYETATFNNTTCVWDVTGTQPAMPTLECWETATFNNTTCVWDVTGTQPAMPTLECWETATFNNTTCVWDVTGTQPAMPTLECWETATFNNTTCVWDVTGAQPPAPTGLACYETATFNNTTCVWDVTGTQPAMPTLACYESATFNNTTCVWDVTGSPLVVTATASGSITCFGGKVSVTVSATGGNPPYSGTGTFMQAAGTTTYTVSDNGTCVETADLTLTEPTKVEGTTTTTPANCGSFDGTATVTASGGDGSYTYLWNDAGSQTTATATGLGTGSYIVTITDGNGCTGTASATITGVGGQPDPAGAIVGPAGACRNTCVVYMVPPVSGATSYAWTLPTGATGTSTTNSITVCFDNTYNGGFLCVTPENTCGVGTQSCINIPVITVKPSQPGFIVGNPNPCGPSVETYSIPASSNALSYTWSVTGAGVVILSGQGTNSVQVSFPAGFGQAVIGVYASNCKGNTSTRSTTLTGIPTHSSPLTGPGYVCANSTGVTYSISAAIGAGSSYLWETTGDITPTRHNVYDV